MEPHDKACTPKEQDPLTNIFACPNCVGSLQSDLTCLVCTSCGAKYKYTDYGIPDLRLTTNRKYQLEFDLTEPLLPDAGFEFKPLDINPRPEVDFSSIQTQPFLSTDILSYFPRARGRSSFALDLGCGRGMHKGVCEHAGFRYVGLDIDSRNASLLGDAHALPFKDNSFEMILSIAVLEHIRFPFVMMREAYRVLKPQGVFIGTVAFLEPFHIDSYYHHTHLGTYNSLKFGGFRVLRVAPSESWTVLTAQAQMGLFPKMPTALSNLLVLPVHIAHKLWWRSAGLFKRDFDANKRVRNTTGMFTFIAVKQ
mgnify:CR=1 FL=1